MDLITYTPFPMKAPLRLISHHGILVSTLSGALLFLSATGLYGKGLSFESTVIEDVVKPGVKSYPFEFPFQNTGERSIEIARIKTTCGCTTAKLGKMIYAPGETGVIKGTFSVGNRQGKQEKMIQVYTRDLSQPEIQLALHLEIPQLVSLKPGLLLWRVGAEPEAKILTVSPNSELGARVLSVESDSTEFAIEATPVGEGSQNYEVVVAPLKTGAAGRALIKIEVGVPDAGTKTLYAHALIR